MFFSLLWVKNLWFPSLGNMLHIELLPPCSRTGLTWTHQYILYSHPLRLSNPSLVCISVGIFILQWEKKFSLNQSISFSLSLSLFGSLSLAFSRILKTTEKITAEKWRRKGRRGRKEERNKRDKMGVAVAETRTADGPLTHSSQSLPLVSVITLCSFIKALIQLFVYYFVIIIQPFKMCS